MIKLPIYKAFIFDMDGVLVNSEHIYTQAETRLFRELGLPVSREEHQRFQGVATDEMWKQLIARYDVPYTVDDLVNLTLEMTLPLFYEVKVTPMDGVIDLLEVLSCRKIPLALASSSYPEVIDHVLDSAGMRYFFSAVVSSAEAGASKPAPDVFIMAAQKLGVDSHECIVIEDSTNGIIAAKAAGMYCIAYNGPGAEHQDHSLADTVVTNYKVLIESLG